MFAETAELYDLLYDWKDYRREAEHVRRVILDRVPEARTLLDVACGTGRHLEHLREHFDVEGVDLDPGLLEVARRRLPGVPLHVADMRDFDLGRGFDAVTCLFSSIGYVGGSSEALGGAVRAMARHLAPRGVLVVEPWLAPDAFDPGRLGRLIVVEHPDLQLVRTNASSVSGRLSVLEFHYLVARPGTVEHRVERHELGLFTHEEYLRGFESAGLLVEHDADGLMGRGLYVATGVGS